MANIRKMHEFFDAVNAIINDMAGEDESRRRMLTEFFVRILSVLDGVEGRDAAWTGLCLVAPEDLPPGTEEINDAFLHDAWTNDCG